MLTRPLACTVVTVTVAFVGIVLSGAPALANDPLDPVNCSDYPRAPGCTVTVDTPSKTGGNGQDDGGSGGSGNDSACRWVEASDRPPPAGVDPASGGWYMKVCGSDGSFLGSAPQWIVNPPEPVNPAVLAQHASADLKLPAPRIRANPNLGADVLVSVPVWLWVDSATWGARSATASVPGVSVTATATPTKVQWQMGDGTTVTCRGPGTPWKAGMDAAAASTTCGHVYRRSSASAPAGRFTIQATVTWAITWTGGGAGGALPALTTTDAAAVRVAESQAINGGVFG